MKLRSTLAPVIVSTLLLTAAACDSAKGGNASAGTGTKTATVMVMGQIGTPAPPTGSYPGIVTSAKAAATAINAKGGVNGYTINVVSCNDNSNPNQAAKCARDAVSQHVDAVVGLWTLYSTNVYPILEAAKIPVLSSVMLGANEATSSAAFPWFSGLPGQYIASAEDMIKLGCKKPAVIYYNITAGLLAPKYVDLDLSKHGMPASIHISAGSGGLPDYAPAIQSAVSQGADCMMSGLAGSQAAKLILANSAAGNPLTIGAFGNPVEIAVGQVGDKGNGVFAIADSPLMTDTSNAAVARYLADMKAVNAASTDIGDTPFIGWIGVQVFAQALAKINGGTVDGPATVKALDGLHVTIPGFLDFTYQFNNSSDFSRVSNFQMITYRVT
ncbi:MAG: ABC transporter substrate-binding protein, partial [Mycobacterium sp.]|nr:ABC transporter substrate-binding protein [Mycobacterium sp.]